MSPLRLGLPAGRAVSPLRLALLEGKAVSPLRVELPEVRLCLPSAWRSLRQGCVSCQIGAP